MAAFFDEKTGANSSDADGRLSLFICLQKIWYTFVLRYLLD